MSFPNYHKREALEQRVRRLLGQLELLSEAESTSVVNFNKHSAKAASKAPKGAFRGRGPDPDESLMVWFLWRLEKAQRQGELAIRVLCAETDVRLERRKKLPEKAAVAGAIYEGERESAKDRDDRIVQAYQGYSAEEASVIKSEYGYVSPANIRLVRLRAKKHPEDGSPQEDVPLTYEDKKQAARDLKREFPATSATEIALKLGVARKTVSGWLNDSNGEKAA